MPAPSKILIVRPGALGDALLTLPVLRALRRNGAARFLILGQPSSWAFLRPDPETLQIADWGGLDWMGLASAEVPLTPQALQRLAGLEGGLLYLPGPDHAARQALAKAGLGQLLLSAPPLATPCPPPAGAGMAPAAPGPPDPANGAGPGPRHAIRTLLEPLGGWLGAAAVSEAAGQAGFDQAAEPLLALGAGERQAAQADLRNLEEQGLRGWLALHPGSGGRTKCWPLERFVEIIRQTRRRLGLQPLVLLGPADEPLTRELARLGPGCGVAFLQRVNRPLREVLALLSLARGYLGNDSGITHLAARCCPTLALFGPSDAHVWAPQGPRVRVLAAGADGLDRLTVEAVLEELQALLGTGE